MCDRLEETREEMMYRCLDEREDHIKMLTILQEHYGCSQPCVSLLECLIVHITTIPHFRGR